MDVDVNSIKFNIYPNPSKGEFTLDLSLSNKDKVDVQIVNLLGKTVYNKENVNSQTQINVSTLENGTYILILKDGDKIIGRKQLVITK